MTTDAFITLAKSYDADVYGDLYSESGWGINFCFDLAYGLWAYLAQNHGGQDTPEYAALSSLAVAPISFFPGPGPDLGAKASDDPEVYDEYETAREIFNDLQVKPWAPYYEALVAYCGKTLEV